MAKTHAGAGEDGIHDQVTAHDVFLHVRVQVGEGRLAVAVEDMPLLRQAKGRLVEE